MHLPFFGHEKPAEAPKLPSEVMAADAAKYPVGGVAITGAERAGDVVQTAEAPATQAPGEVTDTDHQIPAQTA
ncbi:hypothetical protein H0X10_00880 [Candidatus Saccharibacteria bacterium]|nr:hypothetical protein [Candidatus Saccharibacteria bacterium]